MSSDTKGMTKKTMPAEGHKALKEANKSAEDPRPSTERFPEIDAFDELPIREELLRGIYSFGHEDPTPIQKRGILPMLKGKDVICQAQAGTCYFFCGP